jgi:hypothetical protein
MAIDYALCGLMLYSAADRDAYEVDPAAWVARWVRFLIWRSKINVINEMEYAVLCYTPSEVYTER